MIASAVQQPSRIECVTEQKAELTSQMSNDVLSVIEFKSPYSIGLLHAIRKREDPRIVDLSREISLRIGFPHRDHRSELPIKTRVDRHGLLTSSEVFHVRDRGRGS